MFTVTFVRHGETKLNAAKIVQSRTHGELSDKGVQMAEHLGKHIGHERFTRVYSSDLKRCHQTTLNILKHSQHTPPEPVLDPILRERDYGDLEFQPNQIIYDISNETGLNTHAIPLPGGEEYETTKQRTGKFLHKLCKLADASSDPEHALVVTHGAWLMCLMDYIAESRGVHFEIEDFQEEWLSVGPHNTATTRLVIHKNGESNEEVKRKLEILHVHDTTHLPNEYKS